MKQGFAKYLVDKWIEKGGTLVDEEVAEERKAICDACPKKGMVNPVPGEFYEGCTVCGCIIESKVKADIVFNFRKMKKEKNKCPEGKWL